MIKSRGLLIVGLLLLCSRSAFADPISFEAGNPLGLLGWQVAGTVTVEGTVILPPEFGNPPPISPTDGLYQAVITSGGLSAAAMEVFFGMAPGALTTPDANGNSYTRGSGMKRDFNLGAGDQLKFDWNFVSFDAMPFNDAALFIRDGAGTLLSSVELVGDFGRSGYLTHTFTASAAGNYSIGLGVFDFLDEGDLNKSYLAVDNFNVIQATGEVPGPTPVPEPATLLMLTGGFAAVLTARRYRVN